MIDSSILNKFMSSRSASGGQTTGGFTGMTLGLVVDIDDPLQMGRLRVFCPSLNDDPKQLRYIPWAIYASPFAGSINQSAYTRGSGIGPAESTGAVHYGFWAVPEFGAHVLVGCIDGDFRRRFWFGCVPQHQETNTLHTGRWQWDGGTVEGPLTSSGSPLEPLYTNASEAFNGKKDSAEWKTRVADYQTCAVRKDSGQIPNSKKASYVDQTNADIIENEPKDWVHPALGAHGYDWTGFKNMGAYLGPRTYGFSSPGFHMVVLDDRPFNSRIKIRSTSGHQILLDDTNERIYIATNKGKSWIELDTNGNIDMFSENRVSINAAKDVNISTKETFRVHAEKGIHMFSGKKDSQDALDEIPADGQIRMHAIDDIHVITEKNYRHLSVLDSLFEIGGKKCESIGKSLFLQVQDEINIITNTGDYNLTVSGNLNEFVQGNVRKYALGSMRNMSEGDARMHSFRGKMAVGAQKAIAMKSMGEDITLEAVGKNEDRTGGVYMRSPASAYGVSSDGVTTLTTKEIHSKSAKNIDYEIDDTIDKVDPQEVDANAPQSCPITAPLPINGSSGPDLAARLAYNAGFRGEDLVTAVAIAGAESAYNPDATFAGDARPTKWGPSVGMWQIRTLREPGRWSGIDAQRDPAVVGGAANARNNANFAHSVYQRSGFREWSTFTSGAYKEHMSTASAAVNSMCGGAMTALSFGEERFAISFDDIKDIASGCSVSMSTREKCKPSFKPSSNTSISIGVEGLDLQSKIDTKLKSIAANVQTKLADGIVKVINENAAKLNAHQAKVLDFMNTVAAPISDVFGILDTIQSLSRFVQNFDAEAELLRAIGISFPIDFPLSLADFVPDIPWDILLGDICKFKMPEFEIDIDANFKISGFELCEQPDEDSPPDTDPEKVKLTSKVTIR